MISAAERSTLFFDRDVGTRLPIILARLRLPIDIKYHQQHFAENMPDEEWIPEVGRLGWTVIGHDSKHHLRPSERNAILSYHVGCFYLWGNSAPLWQKARCFLSGFDGILKTMRDTERPFLFQIQQDGRLRRVPIS